MIRISGNTLTNYSLMNNYPAGSIEEKIIRMLSLSNAAYDYPSVDYLRFEIMLRINIINAAIELSKSRMKFEVFRKSCCNPEYWQRTSEGGFLLKDYVMASEAIKDIYENGKSYGTECATAIIIIYYKAILGIYPETLYNRLFSSINLMDWHYLDNDIGIQHYDEVPDYIPGDCRYFKNTEVNPKTPEWQGENVIDLGNGKYFGHGVGIASEGKMVKELNKNRRPHAEEPAYILPSAKRAAFNHLAYIYYNFINEDRRIYRQFIRL